MNASIVESPTYVEAEAHWSEKDQMFSCRFHDPEVHEFFGEDKPANEYTLPKGARVDLDLEFQERFPIIAPINP